MCRQRADNSERQTHAVVFAFIKQLEVKVQQVEKREEDGTSWADSKHLALLPRSPGDSSHCDSVGFLFFISGVQLSFETKVFLDGGDTAEALDRRTSCSGGCISTM